MAVTMLADDILDLIKSNWVDTNMENPFTPTFDTDWNLQAWPSARRILVHEVSQTYLPLNLCATDTEVTRTYQIEVFSLDKTEAWDMRQEIDRILADHHMSPVTGITCLLPARWEDLTGSVGNYYRFVLTVTATSFG